jgi:hypothetical protein
MLTGVFFLFLARHRREVEYILRQKASKLKLIRNVHFLNQKSAISMLDNIFTPISDMANVDNKSVLSFAL